ncbi:hypothetical protein V6N12_007668 [Hibiscus sabdariffa]|uniref:Ribosomal protein L22 n=1 Tax=Hibiscus sabdariffa TaxID=183260 RepID=A0ABR2F2F9_9ROSI
MPNEWHTPLEVPGNRLPETGSRRKLLNVRGAWILHYNLKARSMDAKIGRAIEEAKTKIELTLVICRELIDLGRTQRAPAKDVYKPIAISRKGVESRGGTGTSPYLSRKRIHHHYVLNLPPGED